VVKEVIRHHRTIAESVDHNTPAKHDTERND